MNNVTATITPESFYWLLDTYYMGNSGRVTLKLMDDTIVNIFKIGVLFDKQWIRYASGPDDLIDKTLNLDEVKEVVG